MNRWDSRVLTFCFYKTSLLILLNIVVIFSFFSGLKADGKVYIEPYVNVLFEALGDSDSGVHMKAIRAMAGSNFPTASDAVPVLIEILKSSDDEELRQSTAESLGNIGPTASKAFQVLVDALRDNKQEVRERATEVLSTKSFRPSMILSLF